MPKTIEDIIPPSRRRAMGIEDTTPVQPMAPIAPMTDFSSTPPPSSFPPPPSRVTIRTGRGFPYGTAIIALIVVALCAGVIYAFADAKVEIKPTSQTGAVSGNFTATAGTGNLPFTVISVNKTATDYAPAESTESANDSAQGSIVVSNTGTTPEDFVTNTRFETPSGLIFRIHAPITIPAASATGPGALTVTVYADQPGQSYNVGPTTFTVPGLQGTAEYADVTAKSNSAMLGGFTGTHASVSQGTDDNQHASLQTALATQLQSSITSQIPSGDVLVPGATFTSYTPQPDSATTTTTVAISEQGTMTAVVFPEAALAEALAYKIAGTYSGEPVTLNGVSKLSLAPVATSSNPTGSQTFDFTLNGSVTIVWVVDTSKIAGAVAGKTRDSAQEILSGFPEVNQAVLVLRPFWANTFPQDPSHIKVTIIPPSSGS
jgi:hypothetical protein